MPKTYLTAEQIEEVARYADGSAGCIEFVRRRVQIQDNDGRWIPFNLWPEQEEVIHEFFRNDRLIVMKARQVGLSWLFLSIQLWMLTFRPGSAVTVFSKTDREAVYLFRDRLKEMHRQLPRWLQVEPGTLDNDHVWKLQNESVARCFPTSAGDSYTTTVALVDEADLVPDLNRLLLAVEPTVSDGGKIVLISKVDKSKPRSDFKKIYRAAREGRNGYFPVFLPWSVRPSRTTEWYEQEKANSIENHGSLDNLQENYPATEEEALAPRTLDKRIPALWLNGCYSKTAPLGNADGAPSIPGLQVFATPEPKGNYFIGGDPAEGNPTSDDSALSVIKVGAQFEQVASLAGKFEPSTFAGHIKAISAYYNQASVLVERNNHGHAVILWLRDNAYDVYLMPGEDGRSGWVSSTKGKTVMYDTVAEFAKNAEMLIRGQETYLQLVGINGATLRAPEGERDDMADAHALAVLAGLRRPSFGVRSLND